ncbi:transmembrane protein [Thalictrum thalictroides]|uniref:Transmembrane protein n=1 Tax=Thalictrum thalictroides TaxID=46969 RepID=A0A7J6V1W7_THATH|nr:transmembrane protein [Thalictrum thalictroides]
MASSSSSFAISSSLHLLCLLSLAFSLLAVSNEAITIKDVDIQNPVSNLILSPIVHHSSTHGAKHTVSCGRVRVSGLSRLMIKSYANSFQVTLTPSVVPERLFSKIEVCSHGNSSLGLCQCVDDDWRAIQKGNWSISMSPYGDKYLDVKFIDGLSGSITVSIAEDFHQWRLFCLGVGFVFLLLAPILSNWVPFYYSSSMAIGVLLVILVILFQGMRLLPTARMNIIYLTIYGTVLGAGSFLVNYFSMLINSAIVNFGLNEDIYNPVSIFVFVGVVLTGAALGYWIVRKFVMSEDGRVDVGIAHFVKWAMRIIATTFIFQSTLDTCLALLALASCWVICYPITSYKWQEPRSTRQSHPTDVSRWLVRATKSPVNNKGPQFLRSAKSPSGLRSCWYSPKRSLTWSDSPTKGLVLPSPNVLNQDYYSTFHKTPKRKNFSRREWEDFTRESTKQAMAELASSPEFTDWIVENADRIRLDPDQSSDETGNGSDSSEDTSVENNSGLSFFKWY